MKDLIVGKSALTFTHHEHEHDTWEIIVNTKGNGYLTFKDTKRPFREGSIVCIPPGVAHRKDSPDGYLDIWVQTSDFPSLDKTKPTFLTDDTSGNIASLINILYSVQYARLPNKDSVKDSLTDSIQQLILARITKGRPDPRVEAIMNRIIHNFHDPAFSIDECLCVGGYCQDHMRRLFREQVGKTPREYLTYLRIKSAKKLLAARGSSKYSVSDICAMVGFNDVSYFSRVFKKETGIAPSEYHGEKK
ncbi:MAG: helix-turn-helix domain-containing protein [Ruminococcaceae bacterium]|nr:helix-turn-helix domain-containing protein [Oscillospiraceae bacterium]